MEMQVPAQIVTHQWVLPRLKVYYPVVIGLKNSVAQYSINYAIQHLIHQMIKDQGYYENPQTQITGHYELKTNERGILSITFLIYSFSGGAHGMTVVKSLTFDVMTGKQYNLKDLFKPGANYVEVLSKLVLAQIKERDIPLLDNFKGISPDQDYYIADKSLVLYFQLYELAAYVYGILYFPISVYTIQDLIDENGPLGTMLY